MSRILEGSSWKTMKRSWSLGGEPPPPGESQEMAPPVTGSIGSMQYLPPAWQHVTEEDLSCREPEDTPVPVDPLVMASMALFKIFKSGPMLFL